MKTIFLTSILLPLVFMSCNKDNDQDTIKPIINLEAPAKDATFNPGGEIHFEAEFSDNEELKSYKIDIHDASSHSHSKSSTTWSFQKEFDLSGKRNHHAHEHFDIPSDCKAGEYHFVVYCTDKSGNEQIAYTDIIIALAD